jgi:hypothetical protein
VIWRAFVDGLTNDLRSDEEEERGWWRLGSMACRRGNGRGCNERIGFFGLTAEDTGPVMAGITVQTSDRPVAFRRVRDLVEMDRP